MKRIAEPNLANARRRVGKVQLSCLELYMLIHRKIPGCVSPFFPSQFVRSCAEDEKSNFVRLSGGGGYNRDRISPS